MKLDKYEAFQKTTLNCYKNKRLKWKGYISIKRRRDNMLYTYSFRSENPISKTTF